MKSERFQIIQPPGWKDAFKAAADKAGMSLSEWIGDCCFANLPASVQKSLPSTRPSPGNPEFVAKETAEA